ISFASKYIENGFILALLVVDKLMVDYLIDPWFYYSWYTWLLFIYMMLNMFYAMKFDGISDYLDERTQTSYEEIVDWKDSKVVMYTFFRYFIAGLILIINKGIYYVFYELISPEKINAKHKIEESSDKLDLDSTNNGANQNIESLDAVDNENSYEQLPNNYMEYSKKDLEEFDKNTQIFTNQSQC
ncbi:MAG: hypothetical protein MHPSP_003990, partial [Paramarteilia canceri]